jgi:hypothetical protein
MRSPWVASRAFHVAASIAAQDGYVASIAFHELEPLTLTRCTSPPSEPPSEALAPEAVTW